MNVVGSASLRLTLDGSKSLILPGLVVMMEIMRGTIETKECKSKKIRNGMLEKISPKVESDEALSLL